MSAPLRRQMPATESYTCTPTVGVPAHRAPAPQCPWPPSHRNHGLPRPVLPQLWIRLALAARSPDQAMTMVIFVFVHFVPFLLAHMLNKSTSSSSPSVGLCEMSLLCVDFGML
nr:unnamed protein product [Digitaria exilis]